MPADHSALPKYVQTAELLIREIAAGRIADGARLKPEREMAVDLGVSIGTLRKALDDLTEKGLLDRVHGSGNYVRHRAEAAGVYAFFRLELLGGGGLPTAMTLSVDGMAKPDDLPDFGPSERAFRIRRLRHLSGTPAALEEIWLDGSWADHLSKADLSESLYLFYRQRLGLWISGAEDRIGLAPIPDWSDNRFPPRPGTLAGYIERFSRSQDGALAEYSRTWFDTGVARYVSRLR
ncbi:UTRA domain-containing protein [Alphaproteobacteria bacterium GH1-50]|uniref:UTRA domain-containing protein n=1 Tax=Kangsaoukella pontilimi TaxID=2691042 RepID=A0A7C9IEV4_9RHOB|nr:GntR family transcriptional regulator [Kangsaoukella pontilimi]MXQ06809.1 UTRA domain-containing protein [Kangsaoukella pontilimi]